MANYKKILAATDFHNDCLPIVSKAAEIAKQNKAELIIMTVVPSVPYYMASGLASISDIEEQLAEEARAKLEEAEEQLKIKAAIKLRYGCPKQEIVKLALKKETDLIVLGSHGHRGVQKILGSTASGVLHRSKCDVLLVRSKKD